jgi:3-isopropylmalate dehydrogenase
MTKKKIAILPGDGIGPEIIEQAVKVINAVSEIYNVEFELNYGLIGAAAIDATGNPLPDETIELCRNSDAVLLGAVGHPRFDKDPTAKVRPEQGLLKIRKELGLYANIRPIKTYKQLYDISPLKTNLIEGVDFVVYRELTGGSYFGEKGRKDDGKTAYDVCTYSEYEIIRIAKLAFESAQKRRKKLTLVDKANVLESSRLWRETVTKMATDYPDVALDYMYVDNAAMKIVQNPGYFDVVLTENMFGDILTDEASVITGSIGMLPSASVGEGVALFEPIHGSYPEGAGKNIANPYATILSVAMMLEHLDLVKASQMINLSVINALNKGIVTIDINALKYSTTTEVGTYIAKNL